MSSPSVFAVFKGARAGAFRYTGAWPREGRSFVIEASCPSGPYAAECFLNSEGFPGDPSSAGATCASLGVAQKRKAATAAVSPAFRVSRSLGQRHVAS
jgi:hypothetical protein